VSYHAIPNNEYPVLAHTTSPTVCPDIVLTPNVRLRLLKSTSAIGVPIPSIPPLADHYPDFASSTPTD
jgi:hypothetical protein